MLGARDGDAENAPLDEGGGRVGGVYQSVPGLQKGHLSCL